MLTLVTHEVTPLVDFVFSSFSQTVASMSCLFISMAVVSTAPADSSMSKGSMSHCRRKGKVMLQEVSAKYTVPTIAMWSGHQMGLSDPIAGLTLSAS